MALIRILNNLFKQTLGYFGSSKLLKLKFFGLNSYIVLSFFFIFSIIFYGFSSLIIEKNSEKDKNFKEISKNNELSNLTNYFISKINSPYEKIDYSIQKNDTIEKILKKFEIKNSDIKEISSNLRRKKLSNIYSGRKLTMVLKK